MDNLNFVLAKNIALFRKQAKLTQAELAEKLNFSDKSVSKWERGDGIPDLVVLLQMCEIFGVSISDMINEKVKKVTPKREIKRNHMLISLMSVVGVWLLATCAYVICALVAPEGNIGWMSFIIAIPSSFVVLVVFASIWGRKWHLFSFITALIWTLLISICICISSVEWKIIYLGIPMQVILVLWFMMRKTDTGWSFDIKNALIDNEKPQSNEEEKNNAA